MKETRIYAINTDFLTPSDCVKLSDSEFMNIAEEQGSAWSIENFTEAINTGELTISSRIMTVRSIETQTASFKITSISRYDLAEKGFDISNVSDETMERLASRMSDDYCNQLFWESMEIIAESIGIKQIQTY